MIEAHKVKTLQVLFQSISDNVSFVDARLNENLPSAEELGNLDCIMAKVLEDVALWRTNYIHHFGGNEGVKIRD